MPTIAKERKKKQTNEFFISFHECFDIYICIYRYKYISGHGVNVE